MEKAQSIGGMENALILFVSPWCPFSAEMTHVYSEVAALLHSTDSTVQTWQVDGWSDSRLNAHFGVRAFPTLVLAKNGRHYKTLPSRSVHALFHAVATHLGIPKAIGANWTQLGVRQPSSRFLNPADNVHHQSLLDDWVLISAIFFLGMAAPSFIPAVYSKTGAFLEDPMPSVQETLGQVAAGTTLRISCVYPTHCATQRFS